MSEKIGYMFDEVEPSKYGSTLELKEFFGGKGAGLANMTSLGLPIPYGFIIPCKDSLYYAKHHKWQEGLKDQVKAATATLEKQLIIRALDQTRQNVISYTLFYNALWFVVALTLLTF